VRRCRHLNIILDEHAVEFFSWQVERGVFPPEAIRHGHDLTGAISVACEDCGYIRTFGRNAKRPKWVQALEEKIRDSAMGPL
jgi:hypothetical protein